MFGHHVNLTIPPFLAITRTTHWFVLIFGLLFAGGLAWPVQLPAQQTVREQTALKFIPEDAAFFSSSLRWRQQFETLINSKAFARLSGLPFARSMVEEIKSAWSAESPSAPVPAPAKKTPANDKKGDGKPETKTDDADDHEIKDEAASAPTRAGDEWADTIKGLKSFWSDPENRQMVHLGLDAISHEVFLYGDSSIVGFLKELEGLSLSLNGLGNGALLDPAELTPENETIKTLLDALNNLPVPAFVIGFKLSDTAPATAQLARLEKVIQEALQDVPDLAKAFHRQKIGQSEYLTLKLDGSKVPWDELIESLMALDDDDPALEKKLENDDDAPDDAKEKISSAQSKAILKALADRLKKRSLTFSLGLHEKYLLFSFGETNAHLARLSGKFKLLVDRPEFAPLLKMANQPFTGISYVSLEVSRAAQGSTSTVESMRSSLEQLRELIGLDEEEAEKLITDLKAVETEAAKFLPDPGAVVEWEYLTPRGYEAYSYDFGGGDKSRDGSKKLSILDHVGGDPLIVVAARKKGGLEQYQVLAKTLEMMAPHLDTLLEKNLPAPYDENYTQFKQEFSPILEKLHTITQKQLLPSMADGQSAFVLDAKTTRANLHEMLAPPAAPLPIPLPALVYGVSDAPLLKQACRGYFALLQDTVNALSRLFPEEVPAIPLPPPTERDDAVGKLYVYEIPEGGEGESELAPTGGLGKDVAVLSLSPDQAKRLLTKTKFTPHGVLARSSQPAAGLWQVNFAGLIEMIQPWVAYSLTMADAFAPGTVPAEPDETLTAVFEILKCWRGSAGITYFEGKAAVSFSETVFEDLK